MEFIHVSHTVRDSLLKTSKTNDNAPAGPKQRPYADSSYAQNEPTKPALLTITCIREFKLSDELVVNAAYRRYGPLLQYKYDVLPFEST
jgi:hypothetical protein